MKLLIVDDDPDFCELLQEHFEAQFECEVLTAGSPRDALQLIEAQQPEGMLLDVNLRARLNGFHVLAKTREVSPGTKVIMVTGVNDLESIERARLLGAVDYITKPFTVDYLENTVATKIAKHLIYA
jgi:two-component system response regulator (stage 0 sporulation protein A)